MSALICPRTGNLRTAHLLLELSKLESTLRQLGMKVDEALGTSKQTEI